MNNINKRDLDLQSLAHAVEQAGKDCIANGLYAGLACASNMLLFATDMLRRERFPREYYELQFSPSFDKGGRRRSFGWDMTAAQSTFSAWTETAFSTRAICHTGWTGGAIAVDPERDFAGVVLGNRLASKERAMGPRMRLLDLMAK